MIQFTHDEINLMAIYNTGTRAGLIDELTEMRKYLESDETELLAHFSVELPNTRHR